MPENYLEYPLHQGYIHNWLVAGPQAIYVEDLERFTGPEYKLQIARHYHQSDSGITDRPAELAPLKVGDFEGRWEYVHTQDDHFVDLTAFYHICHYLRAWAYAEAVSPVEKEITLVLTTNGPADLWLNGEHVHRQEHFHHQIPFSVSFKANFKKGPNTLLIRFEEVAARECPYAMALQIEGLPENQEAGVRLATTIEPLYRRQTLEKVFEAAFTKQDVFVWDEQVTLFWPEEMEESASITVRLQALNNRIYSETNRMGAARNRAELGQAAQFLEGDYNAVLMPRPKEYYEGGMKIQRKIPLRTIRNRYAQSPYGTYEERRLEALQDAATRINTNIFSSIAEMALGRWSRIDIPQILQTIDSINHRADCSDFYLVGLLGMKYRFEKDPSFPEELKQPLEDCILNFKYWNDEPGSDAMCYTTENHSILFHTCEVLAGQLYPDRVFTNNGQTGRWHQEMGEKRALGWLQKRAATGFLEWDSNCYFEEDTLALTHLADLADDQDVWEMASIILDKMLFTMALNSYKGIFGSTHGRTYTPLIKGAYFESTSGISRLAWGMGVFNNHILGTVSLACSQYELPPLIAEIAAYLPDEMWNREHHVGTEEDFRNSGSRGTGVNKVTYKTPDYMLSSAQDYNPGQPGYQQHIWQATFGPDAVVFTTHPTCASEEGSHRPNFWHGNAILPRVAQWKDVLVSVYNLPESDWMGFTHAYFPVFAFDEYVLRDGWAFARKGDGYLALTASQGIELQTSGDNAYRELRAAGLHNVWLCQLGRVALDGTFAEFQEKVLSKAPSFDDLSVRFETLRDQTLAFAWQGPLTLDGQEQPITGFKHYENPFCTVELNASQMEIQLDDQVLRLVFEQQEEGEEA